VPLRGNKPTQILIHTFLHYLAAAAATEAQVAMVVLPVHPAVTAVLVLPRLVMVTVPATVTLLKVKETIALPLKGMRPLPLLPKGTRPMRLPLLNVLHQ
jgi:hypothetical protein